MVYFGLFLITVLAAIDSAELHHLRRMQRSKHYVSPCESTTEVKSVYTIKGNTSLTVAQNNYLLQKMTQTFCVYEGAPCLDSDSFTEEPTPICSTKTAFRDVTVKTLTNETITVPVEVKIDCVCKTPIQ